jgi:hypothetical protein
MDSTLQSLLTTAEEAVSDLGRAQRRRINDIDFLMAGIGQVCDDLEKVRPLCPAGAQSVILAGELALVRMMMEVCSE